MPRYLNRSALLLAVVVILLPTVYGLFATHTLVLQQAHVPKQAAPTALPHASETTTVYDNAGDPALTFQVANLEIGQPNPPGTNTLRTRLQITIANQTNAPVHFNPATMLGIIDTWGAYQSLTVIDEQDAIASAAAFDLAAGTSQTLRLRLDLPPTAQPNLLVYDAATHFAVLLAFQDAIAGINQPVMTAAIPTLATSWLAPQAGVLTITSADAAARITDRGLQIWQEDHQTAAVSLTFANTQDGRTFWSPDRIAIVDQLGRVYVSFPQPPSTVQGTPVTGIAANLIPARTTLSLSVAFAVPLGTEIRYVIVVAGRAEHVIATQPAGDANQAYNNDLITMLTLASTSCVPYAQWSATSHSALARLDQILLPLATDPASVTADQHLTNASALRALGSDLISAQTSDQLGFSESTWLQSILTQTADALEKAAANGLDAAAVSDLLALRDQFATRLSTLDGFVSTGCGDIVDPALGPNATPDASPVANQLA